MNVAIPDPLRRFVATPFGDTLRHAWGSTQIECNDAGVAKDLVGRFRLHATDALLTAVKHLRIVAEPGVAGGEHTFTRVDTGAVRTLLRGTATILIYDVEERLLLGFLAETVTCMELFQRLIPAVILEAPLDPPPWELQRRDNRSITP